MTEEQHQRELIRKRKWRKANPDKVKAYRKKMYSKHREKRIALTLRIRARNRDKYLAYMREHERNKRIEVRKLILDKLGRKCVKCGFSDERALQVDHIKGNGREELRRLGHRKFAKKVLADKQGEEYQILCANCNTIKKVVNREVYRKYESERTGGEGK